MGRHAFGCRAELTVDHEHAKIGAADHLSPESKTAFSEAYPGDALDRLWWWPPSQPWYTEIRAEYSDKFVAA